MSIHIRPQDEERILKLVESGDYPDTAEVIHDAIVVLQDEIARRRFITAVEAGVRDYEQGNVHDWTPSFIDELRAEAREMRRRGEAPDPDVCP